MWRRRPDPEVGSRKLPERAVRGSATPAHAWGLGARRERRIPGPRRSSGGPPEFFKTRLGIGMSLATQQAQSAFATSELAVTAACPDRLV
jgi:hypothetical protein